MEKPCWFSQYFPELMSWWNGANQARN